jgi:hypothetical protein
MKTSKLFYNTLVVSVIIQFITGIFEIGTLFIHVNPSIIIIKQLMVLEVIVQIIEGLFYLWLLFHFSTVSNVTLKRYVDWSITTPTMLITLITYLIYLDYKERGLDTSTLDFFQLLSQNSTNITYILSLNWLMLLFGYLVEIKLLDTISGVVLGFIPFLIYYFIIYVNYAYRSKNGWKFFIYFFFFWSLYGIAALMPYNIKNAGYNILDIFSKNFFGVFLSYILITQSFSNY